MIHVANCRDEPLMADWFVTAFPFLRELRILFHFAPVSLLAFSLLLSLLDLLPSAGTSPPRHAKS